MPPCYHSETPIREAAMGSVLNSMSARSSNFAHYRHIVGMDGNPRLLMSQQYQNVSELNKYYCIVHIMIQPPF